MPIVTKTKTAEAAAKPIDASAHALPDIVNKPAGPRVLLELAQLSRYVLGHELYVKQVAYAFTEDQAKALLRISLPDTGLPVWKVYSPPKPKLQRNEHGTYVKDMTKKDLPKNDGGTVGVENGEISIGDDSELEGILPTDEEAVDV